MTDLTRRGWLKGLGLIAASPLALAGPEGALLWTPETIARPQLVDPSQPLRVEVSRGTGDPLLTFALNPRSGATEWYAMPDCPLVSLDGTEVGMLRVSVRMWRRGER